MELIFWDVYEIISESEQLTSVKLRGRVRKFALEKGRNVLIENAEDVDNRVRFAIPVGEDSEELVNYIQKIIPGTKIVQVMKETPNPILSKIKVNNSERYS